MQLLLPVPKSRPRMSKRANVKTEKRILYEAMTRENDFQSLERSYRFSVCSLAPSDLSHLYSTLGRIYTIIIHSFVVVEEDVPKTET